MKTESFKGALLSIMLLAAMLAPAFSVGLATAQGTTTYIQPIDDTYVMELDTSANGTYATMYVGAYKDNAERSLLKFDLSTVSGFGKAELFLRTYSIIGSGANVQVQAVSDDSWQEETTIWDDQPALGEIIAGAQLVNVTGTWYSWDVTSYALGEFAGDKIASVALVDTDENSATDHAARFYTKETTTTYKPYLLLTTFDVDVSPYSQSDLPGTTLSYSVTVQNYTGADRTFDLVATDNAGWQISVSPATLTIANGSVGEATLSVVIPSTAAIGDSSRVTVTATAQDDPSITDNESCTAYATGIKPIDDANVYEYYPDSNYGSSSTLYLQSYLDKDERIFLKFSLSSIPADMVITSAKVWLYNWDAAYSAINAQAVSVSDDSWEEETLTWNNQPALGDVLSTTPLDSTVEGVWYSWDVTSFVASEYAGDKVASIGIKAEVEDQSGLYKFDSKEYSDASKHPYLEVTYEPLPIPYVVGSFNGWDTSADPMTLVGTWDGLGLYERTRGLTGNEEIQYKIYVSGDQWWGRDWAPGYYLPQVCQVFSDQGNIYALPPATDDYVFQFRTDGEKWVALKRKTIQVPGTFNGWDVNSDMTYIDGIWVSSTYTVTGPKVEEFKFIMGNTYDFYHWGWELDGEPQSMPHSGVAYRGPNWGTSPWNIKVNFPASTTEEFRIRFNLETGEYWVDDLTAPAAPTLVSPADGSSTTDSTPTLDWSDVEDQSGVTYSLVIEGNAGVPVYIREGIENSEHEVESELAEGTYSWYVQAVDGAGNVSELSAEWQFTVSKPFTVENAHFEPRRFRPSLGQTTTLYYDLSKDAKVRIKIVDRAGSVVRTLVKNKLRSAGTNAEVWDGRADNGEIVAAGRYVAKINARSLEGEIARTKAVVWVK